MRCSFASGEVIHYSIMCCLYSVVYYTVIYYMLRFEHVNIFLAWAFHP